MERKDYQEPTMNVVKLQQHTMLLTGSNSATLNVTYTEEDWNNE